MPKFRDNLTVNANGGALVDLAAGIPARRVVIYEDPVNGAAQGLVYQLGSEAFAVDHTLLAGEKLVLGDSVAFGDNKGPIQGMPAQNLPATTTAWGIAVPYAKDDFVTDEGFLYLCLLAAGSLGHKPNLFPNDWAPIANYRAATIYAKVQSVALATKAIVFEEE